MNTDINMTPYPAHTPPTPPEGMRWEYRGMGWTNGRKLTTFYTLNSEGETGWNPDTTPLGFSDTHYFEAVPIKTDYDPVEDIFRNPSPYAVPKGAPDEEDVLEEALRITKGDRQNQYGPPEQDFARTAALWSALFADKLSRPFEARDVAMAMICLKLSRETHMRKRDSAVDIAGYARLLHIVNQAVEKEVES